jgi:hypothetical protein
VNTFAAIAAALVVAWAALVIVAQRLNPEQSPLSMGMSGLARGHAPWVMKSSFLCRGASALVLLIALPSVLGTAGLALAGFLAFWVWGVGSAALALVDTDMPGEPPTRTGAVHTTLALLAYVCGAAGSVVLSVVLMGSEATTAATVLALPLALVATAAMLLQFVAFGAAAREAQATAEAAALEASAGTAVRTTTPPLPTVAPQLTSIAGAGGSSAARASAARDRPAGAGRGPGGSSLSFAALACYAGLLQRVFVGLLMAWTLLVAAGILRA